MSSLSDFAYCSLSCSLCKFCSHLVVTKYPRLIRGASLNTPSYSWARVNREDTKATAMFMLLLSQSQSLTHTCFNSRHSISLGDIEHRNAKQAGEAYTAHVPWHSQSRALRPLAYTRQGVKVQTCAVHNRALHHISAVESQS